MKKMFCFIAVVALFAFNSCRKDKNDGGVSSTKNAKSYVKMMLNDSPWEATENIAITGTFEDGKYTFLLQATGPNNSSLSFNFEDTMELCYGIYPLISDYNGGSLFIDEDGGWYSTQDDGSMVNIKIIESKKIGNTWFFKGEFFGEVKGGTDDEFLEITKGDFSSIPY